LGADLLSLIIHQIGVVVVFLFGGGAPALVACFRVQGSGFGVQGLGFRVQG
jgi:hypothetical protein